MSASAYRKCCCTPAVPCPTCLTGTTPTAWDATFVSVSWRSFFAFGPYDATMTGTLSGTYRLTSLAAQGSPCGWSIIPTDAVLTFTNPGGATIGRLTRPAMSISIVTVSPSLAAIGLTARWLAPSEDPPGSTDTMPLGFSSGGIFRGSQSVASGTFNCNQSFTLNNTGSSSDNFWGQVSGSVSLSPVM